MQLMKFQRILKQKKAAFCEYATLYVVMKMNANKKYFSYSSESADSCWLLWSYGLRDPPRGVTHLQTSSCHIWHDHWSFHFSPVNDTEEAGPLQTEDIRNPDTTKWLLRDLEPLSKYRFQLRSCTSEGCGTVVSLESTTLETSESTLTETAAS